VASGAPGTPTGVVVFLHPTQATNAALPYAIPSWPTPGAIAVQNFATTAAGLGYVTLYPPYPSDLSNSVATQKGTNLNLIANSITGAGGTDFGTTFVDELGAWWDHMVPYCHAQYGSVPIVVVGFSLGAWAALQVGKNRASTVHAFGGHCIPTLFETLGFSPNPFTGLTCTNIDMAPSFLNANTKPLFIGWNVNDTTVGFKDQAAGGSPPNNCQDIASNAGGTVTTYNSVQGAPGTGHIFDAPADATAMSNWLATV